MTPEEHEHNLYFPQKAIEKIEIALEEYRKKVKIYEEYLRKKGIQK